MTATAPQHASIGELLQEAVAGHQAADLARAEQACDRILAIDPQNADAMNLKAVAAAGQGRAEEAVALLDRAIALAPRFANFVFNKANILAGLGRIEPAREAYEEAIALSPGLPEARLNLGSMLDNSGRTDEAIAVLRALTQMCPEDHRGFYSLGLCLQKRTSESREQHLQEAIAAFRRALSLRPEDADAQFALGIALSQTGDYAAAREHIEAAVRLASDWPNRRRAEALSTLGEILRRAGRHAYAVSAHRNAVALAPSDRDIRYNFAAALYDSGALEEAEDVYRALLKTHPEFAQAYINLGNILRDRGQVDQAGLMFEEALFREPGLAAAYSNLGALCVDQGLLVTGLLLHDAAMTLGTDDASARFDRGTTLLGLGRLSEGWPGYDERYDVPEERLAKRLEPPPYWRGESLQGKDVLLWTEQGLGDQIIYASIIPDVIRAARRCTIECSARLAAVFERSFPTAVIRSYQQPTPLRVANPEEFHYQAPVASLGRYLRPDFASFPKHLGYLRADRATTERLRARYMARAAGRKIVGLSWRSRNERMGADKSAKLLNLAPLLQTPGVMYVNLQYGDCGAELAQVRERLGVDIVDDPDVDAFANVDGFFAQVAAMDLVITTSNTTAHVAGAQNVPVWILLPVRKGVFWYWFRGRPDSPWYPSARLIRATSLRSSGPWEQEVASQAASDLARFAGAHQVQNA